MTDELNRIAQIIKDGEAYTLGSVTVDQLHAAAATITTLTNALTNIVEQVKADWQGDPNEWHCYISAYQDADDLAADPTP